MPKYRVPIVRIGYGFRDIDVEADNIEEACDKALDEAGNHLFSEKASEYEIDGEAEETQPRSLLLREQLEKGGSRGFANRLLPSVPGRLRSGTQPERCILRGTGQKPLQHHRKLQLLLGDLSSRSGGRSLFGIRRLPEEHRNKHTSHIQEGAGT